MWWTIFLFMHVLNSLVARVNIVSKWCYFWTLMVQISPGQFENLAKMTRIPVQSLPKASDGGGPAVKLRNVHLPAGVQTSSQKRSIYTESDTDQTSTPRPPSYRSYNQTQQAKDNSRLLFYRVSIAISTFMHRSYRYRGRINTLFVTNYSQCSL